MSGLEELVKLQKTLVEQAEDALRFRPTRAQELQIEAHKRLKPTTSEQRNKQLFPDL